MRWMNKISGIQREENVVGMIVGEILVQGIGWVVDVLLDRTLYYNLGKKLELLDW